MDEIKSLKELFLVKKEERNVFLFISVRNYRWWNSSINHEVGFPCTVTIHFRQHTEDPNSSFACGVIKTIYTQLWKASSLKQSCLLHGIFCTSLVSFFIMEIISLKSTFLSEPTWLCFVDWKEQAAGCDAHSLVTKVLKQLSSLLIDYVKMFPRSHQLFAWE